MAKRKTSRPEVAQVRTYIEGVAKNLVDRLYGPNGPAWGTKLTELEDVALAVREALSEKMLAQALERQAATNEQRPEPYQNCPSCGRPVAAEAPSRAWCKPLLAMRNGRSPTCTAVVVGGLFPPQSKSLGIDRSDYSPSVQAKIVYAGVTNPSYEQASSDLAELAELSVSAKQVERVTDRIGQERCAERDVEVKAYQELPLVERKGVPAGVEAPEVAVVGVDGGRLQIWEREGESDTGAEQLEPEQGATGTHWREDKIGVILWMKSEVSATDPCPEIPKTFVDPTKILRLARELKAKTAPREDGLRDPPDDQEESTAETSYEWKPPEVTQRILVASRCRWPEFGPKLAQAAWSQGFYGASRQAFVGDGSDNNWTLWRNHFSSFVPILDFIHALSYVFASAMAGRPFSEGWTCYVRWIGWVWQGQVEQVIAELAARQMELGVPIDDEAETSPRKVVAKALTYLQNHKDKMRYAEYRRQGLPIMSSYVESAVKQFNFRVKGTEKFWSEVGADGMLQLRGDHLSDTKPLPEFWKRRQAAANGQRAYRRAA